MSPSGVPGAGARTADSATLHDGLAMALAAGGASLVGMLGWILAARALDPTELGIATAFVSAFLLVAGATELNVGVGLLRWLPASGRRSRALLARALGAVAGLSGVVAALYLLLPGSSVIVEAVTGPSPTAGQHTLGVVLFVVAAMLYALFQQQDYVLVGLRRPWWAPARTLLFAGSRLGILFAAGASLTTTGVVVSWLVPLAACVALVTVQALLLTRPDRALPDDDRDGPDDVAGRLPTLREAAGFLGPTYLGQVATSVMFNQVPLLVVVRFGPETGGRFFLIWQAVTVVDVLALYFSNSLAAGVARDPASAPAQSRALRRRLLLIIGPVLGLGMLLAVPVLSLFGETYTAEAGMLRILLAGLALRLLVVHRLAEHQALGRGVRFARIAVTTTLLVLGLVAAVPTTTADPLTVVAVGFLAIQAVCAATVVVRGHRDPARRDPARRDPLEEPAWSTTTTGGAA